MANKQVTLKRVIDTSGNTDTIHPTTDWAQVESKPSTFTPTSHSHGNITNGGAITANATIATGDHLVIADNSASNALTTSSITFDTSATTQFLRRDGVWTSVDAGNGFVNTTGDTMTGELNLPSYVINTDFYHTWTRKYTVSTTTPATLLYKDGNALPNGGVYRFTAHIAGTGTDNMAQAVFWNANGTWKVNVIGQSGTSSNHPEFVVSGGVPKLITDHSSNYTISVFSERMELEEGGGTDNAQFAFGAGSFLGSVNGVLRYNSGGGSDYTAGSTVWHAGNDGSGSGLDADTLDTIHASAFVRSDASDTMSGDYRIESGSFASLILDRGTTGAGSIVQFENNNGVIGGIGAFGDDGLQFRTTDGTQMVIDASNNVGIGTTSPQVDLHIKGSTAAVRVDRDATSYGGTYQWAEDGTLLWEMKADQDGGNNNSLQLSTASSPIVTFEQNGNVGIGTTSPIKELDVRGGMVIDDISGSYYNEGIRINGGSGTWRGLFLGGAVGSNSGTDANTWAVLRDNSNNFRITNNSSSNVLIYANTSGNVGIGTTSPSQKLEVSGNIRATSSLLAGANLYLNDDNTATDTSIYFGDAASDTAHRLFFDDSDQHFRFSDSLTTSGNVRSTGWMWASGNLHTNGNLYLNYDNTAGNSYVFFGDAGSDAEHYLQFSDATQKFTLTDDLIVTGDVTVNGSFTMVDTNTQTTEQWSVTNDGTGPAVIINQTGAQPVIDIQDDGTSVFKIIDGGNVGIGTTSPGAKLHTVSNSTAYQAMFEHDGTTSGYAPGSILLQSGQANSRGAGIYHYNTVADENWFTGVPYAVEGKKWIVANQYATSQRVDTAQLTYALLTIDSDTGNVGIGTTSPSYKLDVVGNSRIDATSAGATLILGRYSGQPTIKADTDDSGYLIMDSTGGKLGLNWYASDDVSIGLGGGNVGIGTSTPSDKLHIEGNQIISKATTGGQNQIRFQEAGTTKTQITSNYGDNKFYLYHEGGNRLVIDSSGQIGIDESSPHEKLTVGTANARSDVSIFRSGNNLSTNTDIGRISFDADYNSSAINYALIKARSNDLSSVRGSLDFDVKSTSGTLITGLSLYGTNSGVNVGIGTASPAYKLDVAGDVNVTGNFKINGTNIATGTAAEPEWEYLTKVTGASQMTYSSMVPADYEYKFVVEVQTTSEDTSNPYIRINNESTQEYSYQYQSVTQTAETTETVLNQGDAYTSLIYTGADLSSYSTGGTSASTIHRAEFIYSVSPYTTSPGAYTATIRGWAHTHYVSQSGASYDGMVQSTFVGTRDNLFFTEHTRLDYIHDINAGGTDYHEMRVYRRPRK